MDATARVATVDRLGESVVAALRAAGYMESTISQYQKFIRYLKDFIYECTGGVVYSAELGAAFAANTVSPRTGRFSRQRAQDYPRIVALFDSYLATGTVDLAVRTRGGGGPQPHAAAFIELNAGWEQAMAEQGLAAATREAYGRTARNYMAFLESRGITSVDAADGASVLDFLESLLGRWAKSSLHWVVLNFRPFLKFTGRFDLVEALNLARVRRSRRIVEPLSQEDHGTLVTACATGLINARDAAITLLALSTGLRACDIIDLRIGDIDWRTGSISVVQQKTGNPLTLPLPELIGERLGEYLLTGRPKPVHQDDDHVFLRTKAPHLPLADHATIHRVISTAFRTAGVSRSTGGTSLLRHSAASRLVGTRVPVATIAAVLGHASSESTNGYISLDHERLRACVLPVPAGGGS